MNWKEISVQCPNAYKALMEQYPDYEIDSEDEEYLIDRSISYPDILFEPRYLYDFFDTAEIIIWIEHGAKNTFMVKFGWKIALELKGFGNREEAETAAFTKAFVLLENKLAA